MLTVLPMADVPAAYEAPFVAYIIAGLLAAGVFAAIVWLTRYDFPEYVAGLSLMASYGLLIFTRCLIDGRSLGQVLDPRTQSWAMLADVALVGAIVIANLVWYYTTMINDWCYEWWWAPLSFVAGGALSLGWSFFIDRPHYIEAGATALLYDPAKIGHDVVTYWVLSSTLLCLGVPAIITLVRRRGWGPVIIMAALLGLWVVGNLHDVLGGLNVHDLHDAFNWRHLRVDRSFYGR